MLGAKLKRAAAPENESRLDQGQLVAGYESPVNVYESRQVIRNEPDHDQLRVVFLALTQIPKECLVQTVAAHSIIQDLHGGIHTLDLRRPCRAVRNLVPVDERVSESREPQVPGRNARGVLPQAAQPRGVEVIGRRVKARPVQPPQLAVQHLPFGNRSEEHTSELQSP